MQEGHSGTKATIDQQICDNVWNHLQSLEIYVPFTFHLSSFSASRVSLSFQGGMVLASLLTQIEKVKLGFMAERQEMEDG